MGRKNKPEIWTENDTPVGEELKITVALALKKLSMTDSQKELVFPSSLTASERKFIHLTSQKLGFKSKSRGKGSVRYLTVYKKEGSTIMSTEPVLQLAECSRSVILGLLQRCPVTNKERQDLLPGTEKDRLMNPELRDLNLVRSLGRLTPGPPQVPPLPGHSDVTAEARRLPVWKMKDQLLSAINHNQVILVSGETGSGKTTQVPQIILQEASMMNRPCRIFVTQPRRISALSIAERVSTERGEKVGYTVGYQIRLEGKLSPKTLLTFCTTGVLLRTLMGGESTLSSVTHVIVDEVHERDRFTDFLLTVLRDCLPKFRHLKLILMSANLDATLYAKYFNNCPIIDVPGRCYAVKPYFLEDVLKYTNYMTPKIQNALKKIQKKGRGVDEAKEWAKKIVDNLLQTPQDVKAVTKEAAGDETLVSNSEKEKDNGADESNANNESHTMEDMDKCIEKAYTTGDDEYFNQMIYFIMSENVSPDYQHSLTWASPLMVAAGRGRLDIMEQLLALGASVNLKAANEWTAADWAQSTNQHEAFNLLQAYSAYEGIDLKPSDSSNEHPSLTPLSKEDRDLVEAYNLCLSYKSIDTDLIFALCLKIHQSQPPGGILVFLPGYEDIIYVRECIVNEDKLFTQAGKYALFCLHSGMQSSDQKRVFRSCHTGVRKIVLATNIAETSITINDIVYVIDCGTVKEMSFDAISGISCLRAVWVSQASAVQRRGRAGRCQPGICYHLFSRSSFNLLQPHQTPEILRSPLQDLCLHTKLLAMPNMLIADFLARAPEPPAFMAVKNAVLLLKSMDALDPWEDVTELGHHLLDLPLPPHLGKMVVIATILKCLDPVLTIAACLSYRDPFVLPTNAADKDAAKTARKKFASGSLSDHMVFLKAFQSWQKSYSDQWQRKWCDKNFVSGATMEMIHGLRSQVLAQLRSSGFVRARGPGDIRDVNTNSDNWPVVKAALLAGSYPNLIRVDREHRQLRTEKESKVLFHSSSALHNFRPEEVRDRARNLDQAHKALVASLPSDWLFYEEMVRVGVVAHVKIVTLISPLTVLLMAGPMRLPLDALSEPSNRGLGTEGDVSSDSESEERPAGMNCFVKLDPWIQFLGDHPTCSLALQIRHKIHSLILRRLRAPNKPLTQGDEDIVRVLAAILTQEEHNLGLLQPVGVGQRPRPLYSNNHGQDMNNVSFLGQEGNVIFNSPTRIEGESPTLTIPNTAQMPPVISPSTLALSNNRLVSIAPSIHSPQVTPAKASNIVSSAAMSSQCKDSVSTPSLSTQKASRSAKSNVVSTITTPVASTSSNDAGSVEVTQPAGSVNSSSSKYVSNKGSSSAGIQTRQNPGASGEDNKPRFFIIRVGTYKQIEIGQSRGLWAFQYATERKVVPIAQSCPVILIFALNRQNQFYGYARFRGQKSDEKCSEMASYGSPNCPLYKIEWLKKWYVYFHQTRHLINPYTDNLQVHMCRDGQEVEPSVGELLIKVWDKNPTSGYSGNSSTGGNLLMMNDQVPPPPRHPFHPHGPPPHHIGPPMHHPQHGPPPFPRQFRNFGGTSSGWFGGNNNNNFRGAFRGGYRR